MVVQHNLTAMNSNRQLGIVSGSQAKSSEKLSSGYKINRAGDDAAGLKISEKMRSQIRGLNQASTNAQDGVSLIQTAEGALNETHSILQRMNELAVQGANDTNQSIDRDAINQELAALTEELDRISTTTQFNKQELLNGTFSGKKLQVGANKDQYISVTIGAMNASAIGLGKTTEAQSVIYTDGTRQAATEGSIKACIGQAWSKANATFTSTGTGCNKYYFTGMQTSLANSTDVRACMKAIKASTASITLKQDSTKEVAGARVDNYSVANATLSKVQTAINTVSSMRSALGALQNRLEHTIANLDNVAENTQAAESRIRDTDMASEMVEYSKNNILAQAGQAMLAQANQSTQGVLSLLG